MILLRLLAVFCLILLGMTLHEFTCIYAGPQKETKKKVIKGKNARKGIVHKKTIPAEITLTLSPDNKREALPKDLASEVAKCPSVLPALKEHKWRSAISDSRNKCLTLYKLSLWLSLYHGGVDEFLDDYMMLFAEHKLPARTRTTASLERIAVKMNSSEKLVNWFRHHPPQTVDGKMAFASSLNKSKDARTINKILEEVWLEMDLSKEQFQNFLKKFRSFLSFSLNAKRMKYLLWNDKVDGVKMLMPILAKDDQKVARFCLDSIQGKKGLHQAWKLLGPKQKYQPIVLFHLAKWFRRNKMPEMYSFWHDHLPHIQIDDHGWWKELYRTVFNGLHKRQYQEINLLLGRFIPQKEKGNVANSHWMKGWIHIKYMPKNKENLQKALKSFVDLYETASLVTTKSQAAYWAGVACREMGESYQANDWFRKASEYTTTYYGQMASDSLNKPYEVRLDDCGCASYAWMTSTNNNRIVTDFIRLMAEIDMGWEIYDSLLWFTLHAKTQDQGAGILAFTKGVYPPCFVFISRSIMSKFGIQLQGYYPMITSHVINGEVDPALVHAVVHQESSFLHKAVSSAGATGLMQFMSYTARDIAKKIGIKPPTQEDLQNPVINLRLGQRYLSDLMKRYDNCLPAVLAAYNAGPNNANDWIQALGHPCKNIDMTEWIEGLPFFETRHYVKVVLANYRIYKLLMNKKN